MLSDRSNVRVEALEADRPAAGSLAESWVPAIRRAAARLATEDLVMTVAPPSADAPVIDADRLLAAFADTVHAVIAAARPAGLFLSGGDTALAILERLGARGIRLEREMGSGLVFGSLMGGFMEGASVVTKAGAFGPPDALVKLREALADARKSGGF